MKEGSEEIPSMNAQLALVFFLGREECGETVVPCILLELRVAQR